MSCSHPLVLAGGRGGLWGYGSLVPSWGLGSCRFGASVRLPRLVVVGGWGGCCLAVLGCGAWGACGSRCWHRARWLASSMRVQAQGKGPWCPRLPDFLAVRERSATFGCSGNSRRGSRWDGGLGKWLVLDWGQSAFLVFSVGWIGYWCWGSASGGVPRTGACLHQLHYPLQWERWVQVIRGVDTGLHNFNRTVIVYTS